jgi:hypothetical protein
MLRRDDVTDLFTLSTPILVQWVMGSSRSPVCPHRPALHSADTQIRHECLLFGRTERSSRRPRSEGAGLESEVRPARQFGGPR